MLVGALGLAKENLRRHDTCAPAAMAGSAVHPTAMDDKRRASGICDWDAGEWRREIGHAVWPEMGKGMAQ
jgi:hypothetical protein